MREWLDTDRVIIFFRFRPGLAGGCDHRVCRGKGGRQFSPPTIADPCFAQHYIEPYRHGHVSTLTNIDDANLNPCYAQLLKTLSGESQSGGAHFAGRSTLGDC